MKKFPGIYLGIVVQNNDPEFRGRVKIWVPHINETLYDKWNVEKKDRKFKFPGRNIDSDLSLIIGNLREDLPWAEYSSPIIGASSSGVYNARHDKATVSDATYQYGLSGSSQTNEAPSLKLNNENFGEKPGAVYESANTKPVDAFTNTNSNNTNNVNPNGNSYRPSTYSNAAKGIFSVPNVGAHVWVFFRDGVPYYPIYMGYSLGSDDFKSIFQASDDSYQDYPQTYENYDRFGRALEDVNTTTYRNKMVVNQRGAAIEIINTTDRERFKVTAFGGGFIELNNNFNSLFSPKNLQLLTQKDKYETVMGNANSHVGRDSDNIIKGDYFLKVGSLNTTAMADWVSAYSAIAAILALPEGNASKSDLGATITAATDALAAAEAELGFGGNHIETVTKHKFLNVGLVFNTFDSFRISQTPKNVIRYVNVISGGTETGNTDISLVEYTHIDDMPGGNLTHTIGNKYNLLVGSGGIDAKTTGPVSLGGTIMAFTGTQINLASKYDFNLDGGTNLSVIADIMTLRTRGRTQVAVDDNLGITKNLVQGGGSYTEGEKFVQHITAPVEFQVTESTTIQAGTGEWSISGATITKGGGGVISSGDTVAISGGTLTITKPHTHYFKNLPLTLVADAAAVRTAAAAVVNAGSEAAPATAVADHYNTAGGNKNSNPNGPIGGVPG